MVRITLDKPYIPIPVPVTAIKYGLLYNWYAATDVRNIAAAGWELPTSAKFDTLINYAKQGLYFDKGSKALKESGLTYWNHNEGVNTFGFNGRGSGSRDSIGTFYVLTIAAYYHSNDNYTGLNSYGLYLNATHAYNLAMKWGNQNNSTVSKLSGMSIRLVKTTTTLTHGQTGTYNGNDGKVYRTI